MDSTSIRAVHVVNDSTLYYAGSNGDVGFTQSNGLQWEVKQFQYQDSIVPHFRSIASNGKEIYALSIANPALLYRYTDKTIVYQEEHEKVFYDSMKFANEQLGVAMGDPTDNCISILITKDGGDSWTKVPCDRIPVVVEGEAAFAASNTNIKIIDNIIWIVTGGAKARVFKSVDFGDTWEVFDTPIIQGDGPQGIYSVDFAYELNGIVVGGNYSKPNENKANKAITTDGGKTWQLVADGLNPNYKSCVQYVPNTEGKEVFAVGKTGISYSMDGGLTWTEVSKEGYYGIQFANKNVAWLYGHQKLGKIVLPNE
tara:strand:- start:257299 stop:258234 length:936 start_codon:yes stop_codon:yes gene_type:complete